MSLISLQENYAGSMRLTGGYAVFSAAMSMAMVNRRSLAAPVTDIFTFLTARETACISPIPGIRFTLSSLPPLRREGQYISLPVRIEKTPLHGLVRREMKGTGD